MFARVFLVLLAWRACHGECVQVQEMRTGSIDVTAFDILGQSMVPDGADLLDARTLKKLRSAKRGHFEKVLYGEYKLRTWSQGFASLEVPIRLNQPTLAVRAQLALGAECRTFSTLTGTVIPAKPPGQMWVKVIPVHGSGGSEAPIGPDRSFIVSGFDGGQYLIVVMDNSAPIHSEVVVIVAGETKVRIDLQKLI